MTLGANFSQKAFKYVSVTRFTRLYSTKPPPPSISLSNLTKLDNQILSRARDWTKEFSRQSLSRTDVELSFSRSSGPGGQNVNKVNSKATVRCLLSSSWIPEWARESLRTNSNYVRSDDTLLISSSNTRSQSQNVEECLQKLHGIILHAAISPIPGATSAETSERVKQHERRARGRTRVQKKRRSAVKSGRSNHKQSWD